MDPVAWLPLLKSRSSLLGRVAGGRSCRRRGCGSHQGTTAVTRPVEGSCSSCVDRTCRRSSRPFSTSPPATSSATTDADAGQTTPLVAIRSCCYRTPQCP